MPSSSRILPAAAVSFSASTTIAPLTATERLFLSAIFAWCITAAPTWSLCAAATALPLRVALFGLFGKAGGQGAAWALPFR
jgi:hypothetical protein